MANKCVFRSYDAFDRAQGIQLVSLHLVGSSLFVPSSLLLLCVLCASVSKSNVVLTVRAALVY